MANKSLENEILYDFTLGDLHYEAQYYMGRELNEIELKLKSFYKIQLKRLAI